MLYPKDIIEGIQKDKAKSGNDVIMERTKGTATGSIIGGTVGLIYAFVAKKSFLVFGILGVLAGGFVTHSFISKEINKDKPK